MTATASDMAGSFATSCFSPIMDKDANDVVWLDDAGGSVGVGNGDFFEQYVDLVDHHAHPNSSSSTDDDGSAGSLFDGVNDTLFAHIMEDVLPSGLPSYELDPEPDIKLEVEPDHHLLLRQQQADESILQFAIPHRIRNRNGENAGKAEGGASISDSELLRLEGLSMRSPHVALPLTSAAVPPSPASQALGLYTHTHPHPPAEIKGEGRPSRLQSIYSAVRRATARRRPLEQQQQQQPGARSGTLAPAQPVIPQNPGQKLGFVTGFVEDPFLPRSPSPRSRSRNSSAPSGAVSTASWPRPRAAQPAAQSPPAPPPPPPPPAPVSTVWHTETPGDDYLAVGAPDDWWDAGFAPQPDADMAGLAYAAPTNTPAHSHHHHHHHQQLVYGDQYDLFDSFHTPTATSPQHDSHPSGLMIHMPQPLPASRAVAPALLHLHPDNDFALPPPPPPPPQLQPSLPITGPGMSPQRGGSRRPKPRAPSSGARHHGLAGPGCVLASPRKRSGGSGGDAPASATSSPSTPSPTAPRTQRRAASLHSLRTAAAPAAAVRKRRSFTPSSTPRTPRTPGGGRIGFVNLTAQDHDALMGGVAPSGSSKTKARREKEAAERQKKLSEAFLQVVRAAGGDVGKLQREGGLVV